MSAGKVDVLAVMEVVFKRFRLDAVLGGEELAVDAVMLRDAIAAAAELIEAAKLAEGFGRWCMTAKANGCLPTRTERNNRERWIGDNLRAALAKVSP